MPYSLLPLPKLRNLERNLLTSPTPLSDLRERQAGRILPVVLYPIILPIHIYIYVFIRRMVMVHSHSRFQLVSRVSSGTGLSIAYLKTQLN